MSAAKVRRGVQLVAWLVDEHELERAQARATAERLLTSAPRIRGAFHRWWLTGQVSALEVEGYRWRELVTERGLSPIGALLALSLLARQPDEVRTALEEAVPGWEVASALRYARDGEGGEAPGAVRRRGKAAAR